MKGIVFSSKGNDYLVKSGEQFFYCRLAGKMRLEGYKSTNPVAVGDWVEFEFKEGDTWGVINELHERKNYMIRKSTKLSKRTHIIAANLDLLMIIASLKSPRTSTGFIDRMLVTAEAYSIPVCIVFNKTDLLKGDEQEELDYIIAEYELLGYLTFAVSALNPASLTEIKDLLKTRTTLLSGHSGVGKSTLINAIDPNLNLRTADISYKHQKGTHTTTFAEMFELSFGGRVIDTPGIKEFGLVGMEKSEIGDYFPEIRILKSECRFNNCIHVNEPGCAVLKALEEGRIAEFRYFNYLNMLNSNDFKIYED